MKLKRSITTLAIAAFGIAGLMAQDNGSQSSGVQRRSGAELRRGAKESATPGVTQRMQNSMESTPVSDADLDWMKVLYREIDLRKEQNAPLYYPDEVIDGQKNLFRVIMEQVASGQLPVYEYLDGREVFTDQYRVKVRDMLDRFHILYSEAKGSTEKRPRFDIDESDVPANEVLSYYVIERWEMDRRTNKLRCRIEAICPVLHRSGDFGGEAVKYPMFWIKYDDLKPQLLTQTVFLDDSNNLATHTIADYFAMNLYDGEIYKTRNLRNLSLAQMHSDPDRRKEVQDSIQRSLDDYGKKMWVPSLEELEAMRQAREEAAEAAARKAEEKDELATLDADGNPIEGVAEEPAPEQKVNSRAKKGSTSDAKKKSSQNKKKNSKVKRPKSSPKSSSNSNATRSVRNRKK